MATEAPSAQPFMSAALAATGVGTWDYDILRGIVFFDETVALLYGLTPLEGREGVSILRMTEKIHPEDRVRAVDKRAVKIARRGLFVNEYRVAPAPDVVRWVLARGRYEADETGRTARARGVMIDVTDSKIDGYVEGEAFFTADAPVARVDDGRDGTPLQRAAAHALDARRAIDALDASGIRALRSFADALLIEIARQLAVAGRPAPRHLN